MYQAKRRGKERYEHFEPAMHERLRRQLRLETDLPGALERGELRVLNQPTVLLRSGRVSSVEALARWHHPHVGLVEPIEFIPIAERTGLIVPIGRWVLQQACARPAWQDEHPARSALTMHVNCSGRQLESDQLIDDVEAALNDNGLAAPSMVLEITESVAAERPGADPPPPGAPAAGRRARAIDDFGTGYSSLSYLHRLPIDLIKIDESFVDRLAQDSTDMALVDTIVQFAPSWGPPTFAEGIEEQAQADRLRRVDCEYGQGFVFARR